MFATRHAVTRYGWFVAALAMTVGAAELSSSSTHETVVVIPAPVAVPAPAIDVPPPVALPPPACEGPMVPPAYAVLDHVTLRRVTAGTESVEPSTARAPRLVVGRERPFFFGHTLGGPPPLPEWLVSHHGNRSVLNFHREPDGTYVAMADTAVFLIDQHHQTTHGFDLARFRLFSNSTVPGASPDENRMYVIDAHRVGARLIVFANDPQGSGYIASIDIATGIAVWTEQLFSDNSYGFAISHGFIVTGEGREVIVREPDAGTIVARADTKDGPYMMEARSDGRLHGVIQALASDGYTSQVDVTLEP